MQLKDFDKRDTCLQVSLYCTGKFMTHEMGEARNIMCMMDMIEECRLKQLLGHRKNSDYRWSNSGSETPGDNTLLKRPTKWIYDKILSKADIDPYKGLNTDQYRALAIYLWLTRGKESSRDIAWNILAGLGIRGGMLPSLMENAILKIYNYILLFDMFWFTKPLYYLVKPWFIKNAAVELGGVPIEESTTNKISLLPTMKCLGVALPSEEYIRRVYETYFGKGNFIAEAIINGLIKGDVK